MLGRHDALKRTLAQWRRRMGEPREQGYAMPYFRFIESGFEAPAGHRERALTIVGDAIGGTISIRLWAAIPSFTVCASPRRISGSITGRFPVLN